MRIKRSKLREQLAKFNPNHDEKGRFAAGNGGESTEQMYSRHDKETRSLERRHDKERRVDNSKAQNERHQKEAADLRAKHDAEMKAAKAGIYEDNPAAHMKTKSYPAHLVRVDTNKFEGVHGKKPKGFGTWVFSHTDSSGNEKQHEHMGSYTEAKKMAQTLAGKDGATSVNVLG